MEKINFKEIKKIITQISKKKNLPEEKIKEAFEQALSYAWKKEMKMKKEKIEAKIDWEKEKIRFFKKLQIVEKIENPEKEIDLEEAKKIKKDSKVGDEILIEVEPPESFGRISAQTAKQVFLQKLREIEKEVVFQEFKEKEGKVVSGIVQKVEEKAVYFDLGQASGILPRSEQIPNEFYPLGQRMRLYVLEVKQTSSGPEILLSRKHPKLLSRLLELEVPEIAQGQVEIKSCVREPGSRSKVAVQSKVEGLDPVGACVGQRGTRIQAVMQELGGEKIDIIAYSDDPKEYIVNSLSPAKVLRVEILPKNVALALVSKDQLSLAIGRDGQNVRLAAKLTNWKIEVKALEELEKEKEEEIIDEMKKEIEEKTAGEESKQNLES
jgi:N utilization substance protein A